MNFIPCTVASRNGSVRVEHPLFDVEAASRGLGLRETLPDGAPCFLGIRPEDVSVETTGTHGLPATVYASEPLGGETVVDLQLGGRIVKALAPPSLEVAPDASVRVSLDSTRLHLFSEGGEAVLSAAGASLFSVQPRSA